jgi:hypothetical protein
MEMPQESAEGAKILISAFGLRLPAGDITRHLHGIGISRPL